MNCGCRAASLKITAAPLMSAGVSHEAITGAGLRIMRCHETQHGPALNAIYAVNCSAAAELYALPAALSWLH